MTLLLLTVHTDNPKVNESLAKMLDNKSVGRVVDTTYDIGIMFGLVTLGYWFSAIAWIWHMFAGHLILSRAKELKEQIA